MSGRVTKPGLRSGRKGSLFPVPRSLALIDFPAPLTYIQAMVIVESPIFQKQIICTLSDEDYRLFQSMLLKRPDAGRIITGSGGLRKVRWAAQGHGKRGGLRIIYYWFSARGTILLLFVYPKNAQENLTPDQLKQLKKVIEEEYHER